MGKTLSLIGLSLTLIGASLLFVYGLPRKRFGNVIISGDTVMKCDPEPGERDVSEEEWMPIANNFQARAKLLNSAGFALVALGTLLQIVAVLIFTEK